MDSLTHIVAGALIGEACAGKTLGKRAMLIGAAMQSLPDIDIVASFWLSPEDDLLAHRGITHSILFAIVATLGLAFVLFKSHRGVVPWRLWIVFLGLEIFCHLFLDLFNTYGTGLFEPFLPTRISFNVLFVADPFFTLWPILGTLALLGLPAVSRLRKKIAAMGLALCALYLGYAVVNKTLVNAEARRNFQAQHISYSRYFTTPTPFNCWLWYVVAKTDSGYYTGYRSVFDGTDHIALQFIPRGDELLTAVQDRQDVKQLMRFAKGFYVATHDGDTLMFSDLRFGQVAGWTDPKGPFVFQYNLNDVNANRVVIQRGRVKDLHEETLSSLIRRIRGK
jgi:inner membrane protein